MKQEAVSTNEMITGADLLIKTLENANVDTIFGYPGGAVLPIYDALYRNNASFKHYLFRHEQGMIHAAEGYARTTGKAGVVIATSGPGATNLVTGITDAVMDSLPLVIFTGQVAKDVIGTDAFQESDVMGITTPITKYNYQVNKLSELPRIVNEAFHIATTGRPGPVVIDIPKNLSQEKTLATFNNEMDLPGYHPTTKPNPLQIRKLMRTLSHAKRPVILAGAGVSTANGAEELRQFAERYQLPVVNTLLGLGSFPGTNPQSLGMGGMHGNYTANMAMYESDFLINIGARFDDRLTGSIPSFAPNATIAHIDIDPAEIGKNVTTEIPVVSDAKEALLAMLNSDAEMPKHQEWLGQLDENKHKYPYWYDHSESLISPQWLIEEVYKATKGEAIVATDVGQHQMWAAQFYAFDKPYNWLTSGGLGTMGYGLPAAIGAQIGRPDETVVAVVGDGGFQMTMQELAVMQTEKLPVKVLIVNNQSLGMVRQWQELQFDERYSESLLPEESGPDYVKLAESFGIRGVRAAKEDGLPELLQDIFEYDGPVLADLRVEPKELVYPMIPSGKGFKEMIGVTK